MKRSRFTEVQILAILSRARAVCLLQTSAASTGSATRPIISMDGSPSASDLSDDRERYRVPTSIRRHQTIAGAPKWEIRVCKGLNNWAAS